MSESPDQTVLLDQLRGLLDTMYGGYVAGDRSAIDQLLDPQLTMFDSASPNLVTGLADLDALRATRSGEEIDQIALTVLDPRIREIEHTIVATWWLRVDGSRPDGSAEVPELCRNSAVLRRQGTGLVIVHLHEDVWQRFGGPACEHPPALP